MTTEAKLSFLLGSGVSRPANAPMVGDITSRIINGEWQGHTDETFIPLLHRNPNIPNDLAERAQEVIRRLHRRIEGHLATREGRVPHYEDYFACLYQIVQDANGDIVNPLIGDFVNGFKAECSDLHEGQHAYIAHATDSGVERDSFATLVDQATRLIQWGVYHSLAPIVKPAGLALISEAARQFGSIDIFSLNHDLLMERHLANEAIDFADGFDERDGDAMLFSWSWNTSVAPVRLFKLHGSIDWYRFRFESRGVDQYAKVLGEPDHAKDSTGTRLWSLDNGPRFLTGTTVKEQAYGSDIFGELFMQFRQRPKGNQTLICSGYGWEDKGINIRINEWLRGARKNRVVILHGKEGENLAQKRFWWTRWEKYVEAKKLILVPLWLCQCSLADIQEFLF